MKLASPCGQINQIRRDHPLTNEELMAHVLMCIKLVKYDSKITCRYLYG